VRLRARHELVAMQTVNGIVRVERSDDARVLHE
jgi:hypothetical protein